MSPSGTKLLGGSTRIRSVSKAPAGGTHWSKRGTPVMRVHDRPEGEIERCTRPVQGQDFPNRCNGKTLHEVWSIEKSVCALAEGLVWVVLAAGSGE